jgi:hypothetical protein
MKSTSTLIIIILFLGFFMPSTAQTVEYNYDASGNITSRKIIILASIQDSTTTPRVFEDTLINVKLYPDYALKQLKVEVADDEINDPVEFRLCDMEGRLLSSAENYEAGNYLDIGKITNEACILSMSRNGKTSSWHIMIL